MPTPENIELLCAINGGDEATGGIEADHSDDVVLSITPQADIEHLKYEIYDFPEGWSEPSGWDTDASGVYFYETAGSGDAPEFTIPASTALWGKFMFRVTANYGLRGQDVPAPDLIDERTAISVLHSSGLEDIGFGEGSQFGGFRSWVRVIKRMLRVVASGDFGGGGGGGSGTGAGDWATFTPTLANSAGTADVGNGTYRARWRRNGDALDIEALLVCGTTTTLGANDGNVFTSPIGVIIPLPGGYTVDEDKGIPTGSAGSSYIPCDLTGKIGSTAHKSVPILAVLIDAGSGVKAYATINTGITSPDNGDTWLLRASIPVNEPP